MGKKIAVIVPGMPTGGVRTSVNKLLYGLKREGFHVELLHHEGTLPLVTLRDFKKMGRVKYFDSVIYMGSIPLPSSFVADNAFLFVHGFLFHEIMANLKSSLLKFKLGGIYTLTLWNIAKLIKSIDFYVCHSVTACEANNIFEKYILLPQFIFPEEIQTYELFSKPYRTMKSNMTTIVTYGSFASSPRLLPISYIISLLEKVSKKLGRKLKVIAIDPRTVRVESHHNVIVEYIKPLPRREFLHLLASADLYFERCVDEELGNTSVEAGLLGVPVTKLTHPIFLERADYRDEILQATSAKVLIDMLTEYIIKLDYWKPYYSKKIREFLITRRNWDHVKTSLVTNL
mgnify:CR=1 FL=1